MGTTTLTIDDELADELESYGATRNEQVESVLDLARSVQGTGDPNSDVIDTVEWLESRVEELQSQIDRLPENIASELR